MFIKRNRSRRGDKEYSSTLLVQGERVPAPRKPGRPQKGVPHKTLVRHRTLANLSHLPAPLIELIGQFCKAERKGESLDGFVATDEPTIGPAYGAMAALLSLAREAGIERALGTHRVGRLAMFLVLARVIHRGSRLSSIRWAKTQAVREVLGLESFDEDDLYAALDWLEGEQQRIEKELAPAAKNGAIFLYDVTSSYLEGQKNELAAPGYNRDGKKYKKQIVAGLLTDQDGEPISIQVYSGNTHDTKTVGDQVRKLAEDFGAEDVVLVGDRGMIKAKGKELLHEQGFHYITSLTDPQIRKALSTGELQLDLFDDHVTEVELADGRRYILRRNLAMTQRARNRRADQLKKVTEKIAERNALVMLSKRADPKVSFRRAENWVKSYQLRSYVSIELKGREVHIIVDEEARKDKEKLDGCYVVVTDVPSEQVDAQSIWDRYGDLQKVERDFRTMKTGHLELRPIFLRKAIRTRAHALVTMLGLKLERALHRRVAPLGLTSQDALDRLQGVRLITLADPTLRLWRLPTQWPAEQEEVLDVLPRLPAPLLSLQIPTAPA